MKWMIHLLLTVLLAASTTAHAASFYKWKDANGQWHFSDQLPAGVDAERGSVDASAPPPGVSRGNATGASVEEPPQRRSQRVVMYSTAWCGYCKKARAFFRKNRIFFSEYDIEKSAKAKRDHERHGGGGVPLILVGKKKVRGFDQATLTRLLGL